MLMSSLQSSGFGLDSSYSSILPAARASHLPVHLPFTSQLPTDTHAHAMPEEPEGAGRALFCYLGLKEVTNKCTSGQYCASVLERGCFLLELPKRGNIFWGCRWLLNPSSTAATHGLVRSFDCSCRDRLSQHKSCCLKRN